MKIKQITLFKSKTVGSLDINGKTRFKKIQLEVVGEVEEGEDRDKAFDVASDYLNKCIIKEAKK